MNSEREQIEQLVNILSCIAYHAGGTITIPMMPAQYDGMPITINWNTDKEKREHKVTVMRQVPFGEPR